MCGFIGVFSENKANHNIEYALSLILHRGPDDKGIHKSPDGLCSLGFRRLSIMDLSKQAHQPMCNEDGSIWIVFNGEIYDFHPFRRILMEKGHRFKSLSDTEVLIHGYEEYGIDLLEKIDGMFAFAILDVSKRLLFLARDRLGIKPLYYYHDGTTFCFASELKALEGIQPLNLSLDNTAIYDFLTYLYIPTPKTLYKKISKLYPGHYLLFNCTKGTYTKKSYWNLEYAPNHSMTLEKSASQLRDIIGQSVESQIVADVPLGFFLSGGIDSSIVVSAASEFSNFLKTFSIGFDISRTMRQTMLQLWPKGSRLNITQRYCHLTAPKNSMTK